jgi:hypothetical protein
MKYILTTENTENTEKSPANIIAGSEQLKVNKIHFQLSTFNFQLIKRSKPKIRSQRVGIK